MKFKLLILTAVSIVTSMFFVQASGATITGDPASVNTLTKVLSAMKKPVNRVRVETSGDGSKDVYNFNFKKKLITYKSHSRNFGDTYFVYTPKLTYSYSVSERCWHTSKVDKKSGFTDNYYAVKKNELSQFLDLNPNYPSTTFTASPSAVVNSFNVNINLILGDGSISTDYQISYNPKNYSLIKTIPLQADEENIYYTSATYKYKGIVSKAPKMKICKFNT